MVASLTRIVGDLGIAEDAVQDAFVAALERWARDGPPVNPAAWIVTTARNKAFDRLRRDAKRQDKHRDAHRSLAALDAWDAPDPSVVRDDMLRLVFMCCHPVLPPESRVALALKALCGMTTLQVARLLLLSESATAQRIVRGKRQLSDSSVRFVAPTSHELPDRLPAVLATVHLLFTEGHSSTTAESHVRDELCDEAIRLAQLLVDLMPDEPEVLGLHALVELVDARRMTRLDEGGDIVLLADQDRSRWNRDAIEHAASEVETALRIGRPGRYQLEAAIAACHALAPTYGDTDWVEITALYALLDQIAPSTTVTLNRAVALAEAVNPGVGLDALCELDGALDHHHLRWAVEADLHRRLGDVASAVDCYRHAIGCNPNATELRFLEGRIAALGHP